MHTGRQQGWSNYFPWPTLSINVLGSFALGVLAVLCRERPAALLLLGTGVCGGFTTFSTFSLEAIVLIQEKRWLAVAGYATGSVVAAVLGAMAGLKLAERSVL